MNSEELFNESKNYFPGGVNSPVRAFKPYPFFVKSAGGSKLTDEDGKIINIKSNSNKTHIQI